MSTLRPGQVRGHHIQTGLWLAVLYLCEAGERVGGGVLKANPGGLGLGPPKPHTLWALTGLGVSAGGHQGPLRCQRLSGMVHACSPNQPHLEDGELADLGECLETAVPFPADAPFRPLLAQTSAAAQVPTQAGFRHSESRGTAPRSWGAAPGAELLPLSQSQPLCVGSLESLWALNVAQFHRRRNSSTRPVPIGASTFK